MLPEKTVSSQKIVEAFVKTNLPGHTNKPVPGDGYCVIHAFLEKLLSIGCKSTFDDLKICHQKALQTDK